MWDVTQYCGQCYGASPSKRQKIGCCNTCEEVKDVHAALSLVAGNADEQIVQCVRERELYS